MAIVVVAPSAQPTIRADGRGEDGESVCCNPHHQQQHVVVGGVGCELQFASVSDTEVASL